MAAVITRLGRRVLELGVGLFALLGFAYVPLGKKTGLEHVEAILATEPAKEAGRELVAACQRLRAKLFDGARPANTAPDAGPPLVYIAPLVEEDPDAGASALVPGTVQ
jgi:hypothetical protein